MTIPTPPQPQREPILRRFASSTLNYFLQAPRNIVETYQFAGPAHASLKASMLSLALFGLTILIAIPALATIVATGLAIPHLAASRLMDMAAGFVFILPIMLALSAILPAVGLALLALFTKSEKPGTIAAAILLSIYLLAAYGIAAFGPLLLAS